MYTLSKPGHSPTKVSTCLLFCPTILAFQIAQQQQLQKENRQGSALTTLTAFNSPYGSESGFSASQEEALVTSQVLVTSPKKIIKQKIINEHLSSHCPPEDGSSWTLSKEKFSIHSTSQTLKLSSGKPVQLHAWAKCHLPLHFTWHPNQHRLRETGTVVDAAYLDFSKAKGMVCHAVLKAKLLRPHGLDSWPTR